nr:hypothetical protein [uncultured Blautia sp.]
MKKKKKAVTIYITRNTGKIVESGAFIRNIDRQLINEEIQNVLLEVSFKTQSIVPYVVVLKLLIENESASLHAFASTLLSNPLCWMEGAYYAGFLISLARSSSADTFSQFAMMMKFSTFHLADVAGGKVSHFCKSSLGLDKAHRQVYTLNIAKY